MKDGMAFGDGCAVQMQCGHPNKKPGEKCELCGETVKGEKVGTISIEASIHDDSTEEIT